jgi:hypothetical protein
MWQSGDKAVCIKGGTWFDIESKKPAMFQPDKDAIYQVTGVHTAPEGTFLYLKGYEFSGRYDAVSFRKLVDYNLSVSAKELLTAPVEIPTPVRKPSFV